MPLLRLWDGKHIHCLFRRNLRRSHQRPNGRKALRLPSFYRILHAIANKILQKIFLPQNPRAPRKYKGFRKTRTFDPCHLLQYAFF